MAGDDGPLAALPEAAGGGGVNYQDFLNSKRRVWGGAGRNAAASLPSRLFDWQDAITRWALRKGRAAIFADCGLGKTLMQLAWAHALDVPTLILAPLCVAEQTVAEGARLGVGVRYAVDETEATRDGITITNYERLEKFDTGRYQAVVLDESSILKSFDGKTRTKLIETFRETPYRLCCTATPSPNDISELANHAEFLGLMTRPEFLATWFVHDDQGWRMKRHAVTAFYRWMASWAIALRTPSDLGYAQNGFNLTPLSIEEHIVPCDRIDGALFPELGLKGLGGRLAARRGSLEHRVEAAQKLSQRPGQWVMWCGLNDESRALCAAIPDAAEVKGQDAYEDKVDTVRGFVGGDIRVLVTKPKILGFGMNFQQCHQMAFVGLSDSYETYYQCIRRCWRYGQRSSVKVSIVVSDAERAIVENVRRKERAASTLTADLLEHVQGFEREELTA